MKYLPKIGLFSTKTNLLNNLLMKYILIWILIVVNIDRNEAKVTSKRKLCADNECTVPIASGKTTSMYLSDDNISLMFKPHQKVMIYGKTEDKKHFYIEINGKRGFAPKNYILEQKVFEKNPKVLVDIDFKSENKNSDKKLQNEEMDSNVNEDKSTEQNTVIPSLHENIDDSQTSTPVKDNSTLIERTPPLDSIIKTEDIKPNGLADSDYQSVNVNSDKTIQNEEMNSNESNDKSEEKTKLYSSLSESIGELQTSTPLNDNYTVFDGTTFYEPIDETEAISPNTSVDNDLNANVSSDESVQNVDTDSNESQETSTEETEVLSSLSDSTDESHTRTTKDEITVTDATPPLEPFVETEDKNQNVSVGVDSDSVIVSSDPTVVNKEYDINDTQKNNTEETESIPLSNNTDESHTIAAKEDTTVTDAMLPLDSNVETEDKNSNISVGVHSESVNTNSNETIENEELVTNESKINTTEEIKTNPLSENTNETHTVAAKEDIAVADATLPLDSNVETEDKTPNISDYFESVNVNSDQTVLNEEIDSNESKQNITEESNLFPSLPENVGESHTSAIRDDLTTDGKPILDSIVETKDIFKWMGLDGMAVTDVIIAIIPEDLELMLKQFQISVQVVVFSFIIAFNWCAMKIILSIFNSSKKEKDLREISCRAQRQLYYYNAEKEKLQTEIDREREKAQIAEERVESAEHKVIPLEKECRKLKNERELLQHKVINLESELESASEAALEASKLLNDFLTSQKENINLNSSVEALQQQITKQADIVAKYESTALQKEKENLELKERAEKMNSELVRLKNVLKVTEHNLQNVQKNNEELKASKTEVNSTLYTLQEEYSSLQNKSDEYIAKNDELLNDVQNLREENIDLKEQIANKDLEIESFKEILTNVMSNMRSNDETDDLNDEQMDGEKHSNDLFDVLKLQMELKNLQNNKNELSFKLTEVSELYKQLNDKYVSLEEDNNVLKAEKESAFQDRLKAQMELEVLSKYYKEKELELGKEIGVQHVQRLQKEDESSSMANQLAAVEDENLSLRSQLQSMKKEIENTERKYKTQINQLEKQVHENWILARNADRKLEESKAEASVLRQTLTMSVRSPVDGFGNDVSYLDDSASSVSSLHDQFGASLPPPPPPPLPPLPPPPPLLSNFNHMIPGMHLQFNNETDSSTHWSPNMNSMSFPPIAPHYQQNNFAPIHMEPNNNNNTNAYPSVNANLNSLTYVPSVQQQWDSSSIRDTFSPSSHRSNSSPHSQYNMYSQSIAPQSHYSNQMTSISSPLSNSMSTHYSNASPLVNSSPSVNVLSNPVPSHWRAPNGNIPNLDYSQHEYIESEGSSRPTSRNDTSLHTSIV